MEFVNALMRDADARQASHDRDSVRVWMKRFKSVAYDVEDLLDKFEATELLRRNQSKVLVMLNFNASIIMFFYYSSCI